MVKKTVLLFWLLCPMALFALSKIKTFQANFVQNITNEQAQSVTYKGRLSFKTPYFSKWIYTSPVQKKIYFNKNDVFIVDDLLEQVTVAKLNRQLNLSKLLKKAKRQKSNHYRAKFANTIYNIFLKTRPSPKSPIKMVWTTASLSLLPNKKPISLYQEVV